MRLLTEDTISLSIKTMRAMLYAGGKEIPVQMLNLVPLGAEFACARPPTDSRVEVLLQSGEEQILLPAEVIRRTTERLWLVFQLDDLHLLEKLQRFCAAFSSGSEVESGADTAPPANTGPVLRVDFSWTPPASSVVVDSEITDGQTASNFSAPSGIWAALPTIVPPPALAAATAAPAEKPAEPPARERRETERQEKSIPVKFDNLTSLIKEFTHNISFGGMLIYTERDVHEGEQLDVTLIHPATGERLTLPAKVVHISPATPDPVSGKVRRGVGVQFCLPGEELKSLLADFIDARQRKPPEMKQLLEEAHRLLQVAASGPRALLGVGPLADASEIRRAYFSLVDRYHPDRYRGKLNPVELHLLEELFRRLTAAYETLQER